MNQLSFEDGLKRWPYLEGITEEQWREIVSGFSLSRRQEQLVIGILMGLKTRAIASATSCSTHTVRTHCKRLYQKLHVHSRAQLVAKVMGTLNGL